MIGVGDEPCPEEWDRDELAAGDGQRAMCGVGRCKF